LHGRLVKTLVQDVLEAGSYSHVWRGQDSRGRTMASGVYYYVLKTPTSTNVQKMMLLK